MIREVGRMHGDYGETILWQRFSLRRKRRPQGSKGMSVPEANIGVTRVQSASSQGGPVVLQVVPSLVTGGVERGTIEIAAAIVADGGTAIVASEGGAMENDQRRPGALRLKLPADTT